MYLRGLRVGDGKSNSAGGSSKHSDSMSDSGNNNSSSNSNNKSSVPYEILLKDLTQAKRQLLELHNLVSKF